MLMFGGDGTRDIISFKEVFPDYKESTITLEELELKLEEINSEKANNPILKREK